MAQAVFMWGTEARIRPMLLTEMKYQTRGLGYFPCLADRVRHLITWGPGSQNMSAEVGPDREHAIERTQKAMERAGMPGLDRTMKIVPQGPADAQILEVTADMFDGRSRGSGDLETHSNFIYTQDSNIVLAVKPGDCTVSIISGILPDGSPIVGLLHGGRNQLDQQLGYRAIQKFLELGCNVDEIVIGIAPSISADNYFIRSEDRGLLRKPNEWKKRGRLKEDMLRNRIYLEILGYLTDQFLEAGVAVENIEAYGIDTLSAAELGEGFSQRRGSYTGNPDNNGRFLVAAQILT